MGKGARRERECRKIYESAGFWVYSPQNPKYGDNDLWNLFDLACYRRTDSTLRLVQVKSNGARGIRKWCTVARNFEDVGRVHVDFVVPYDGKGWRLIQPDDDGHATVYDERDHDVKMGDGLTEFLRLGDSSEDL